jgi:hypothetical protein
VKDNLLVRNYGLYQGFLDSHNCEERLQTGIDVEVLHHEDHFKAREEGVHGLDTVQEL